MDKNELHLTSSTVKHECLNVVQKTRAVSSIIECSNDSQSRVETYTQLCDLFRPRAEALCYDIIIEENGTIQVRTTTSTTRTIENVLSELRESEKVRLEC